MSNVTQIPGRKTKRTLEEAIDLGLREASKAGITQRVLLFKVPSGYVASENETLIRQYLENDP